MYEVLLIIAIISIIIYLYVSSYKPSLVYVRSDVDKNIYIVRNLENKKKAANTLAKVRIKLDELCEKLKNKFGKGDKRVNLLLKRFNSNELRESLPRGKQTSYSINKGEKVVICLRSRNKNETITDVNTLTFVAIHELAHVMSISVGHNTEFWNNFRFLLAHAIHWKIYKPQDFEKTPKKYCGLTITSSPLALTDLQKYINF